ncbi:MAG TPA: hypothetical protein P5509_06890 [Bacteroidales bacterium]|nr:hypothetical protein [Bacteroidales bacterium]
MKNKCVCAYCNNIFYSKNSNSEFCSHSCRMKHKWTLPEYKNKMSEAQKEAQNRPEVKEKHKENSTNLFKDEAYKNNFKQKMKEYANIPENKERLQKQLRKEARSVGGRKRRSDLMTSRYKKQENRKLQSDKQKEAQNRPGVKEKSKITALNNWANIEFKKRMINIQKEIHASEEYRNKISQTLIKKWKDSEYAQKHFKLSCAYKEFELPSGRIVKLQGYEPQVLEQLLNVYNEDDIVCEVKYINEEIGKILYNFEDKERRYYPDFYIKSTNTIIEVKSQWTFDKWKDKNLAKEQACLQQGFNFEFIIL